MLSKLILLPILLPFFIMGFVIRGVVIVMEWLFYNIGWAFSLGMGE